MIYLDNAATSFPKPDPVIEAVMRYMREIGASPGRSSHRLGRLADETVFKARRALARLFGVHRSEYIVFTANATEAINVAIKGILSRGRHAITTSLEHNAVLRPLRTMVQHGARLSIIKSGGGPVAPEDVRRAINRDTRLIVTTFASNVTGALMPVKEIGEVAKAHGIPYLVDAAQAAGSVSINIDESPIDLLAFTGHKALLGPMGTGGLYIAEHVDFDPLKEGGTGSNSTSLLQPQALPDKFEAGTLNGPGIAGLGAAAQYILDAGIASIRERELALANRLEEGLFGIAGVKVRSWPGRSERIALTSITFDGLSSQEAAHRLDQEFGVCVRGGLHCAPEAHKSIHTYPHGTVRFSPGPFTSESDIDAAIAAVRRIAA
ncbi:aminotransferase class V-fold PLP-dependent enzyme [Candidatus Poribacteria bacterium]|nr:aminotransferase class V-fold PLP-dependent enzyme [Candidatus Poribacteria bacterium]